MTRNGKIARLPQDIREELNERIRNGQTAEQLLDWLHAQERVWEVLEAHGFDAITIQNALNNLGAVQTAGSVTVTDNHGGVGTRSGTFP